MIPGRAAWLGLAALILSCSPAESQWEVTPGIGLYLPLGSVVAVSGPAEVETLDMRHLPTAMAGARIGGRLGAFSLEIGAEYSPSLVAVRDAEETSDVSSAVLFGSARLLARVAGDGAGPGWSFRVGGGPALLARWGDAWEGFAGTTDLAFTAGVVAGFEPRRLPVAFRLEVADYVYDARFGTRDGQTLGTGIRSELIWLVGVTLDFDGGRSP